RRRPGGDCERAEDARPDRHAARIGPAAALAGRLGIDHAVRRRRLVVLLLSVAASLDNAATVGGESIGDLELEDGSVGERRDEMHGADSLERRISQFLTPPGFFLGLALGFVACCVLGRQLPKLLPMQNVERLHTYLNPQALYFPTALQIRALARRQLPRDKVAVVISGNSVLMGSGQSVDELWTKELQRELGDEYRFLNLSTPSGAPNEFGQAAVEMICSDHPRVLHVCNCNPRAYALAVDGSARTYRYFTHDALSRGLLQPFPERDQALADLQRQRADEPSFAELRQQTQANRWLSFNDLWHVVGYEVCFTVWTAPSCIH